MSGSRAVVGVRAILLDIEGTTTPIAFVTQVLFPYARKHLRSYLEQHAASLELQSLLTRFREEHESMSRHDEDVPPWNDDAPAARVAAIGDFVEWLMDRDRKSTALKELQGRIWEDGYRRGVLIGEVFQDVPPALQRWHEQGLQVGIFSSGSVLAQQLLFRHSSAGDLTPWLRWYFNTNVGPKFESHSYRQIARAVGLPCETVLFLSDVTRELDAAREAGLQVRLSVRPDNPPAPEGHGYEMIGSFDDVRFEMRDQGSP